MTIRGAMRRSLASTIGVLVTVAVGIPSVGAAASPALTAAKACRKAISVQGRTYAKKRLGYLLGCADKLLKCELVAEIDGVNASSCRSSARDSCADKIGSSSDSSLSKAATKFGDKAGTACLAMSYADVVSTTAGGLWFGNDATCGTSIDLPTLLACVRGELEARVDALASEVKPRTALLLDNVGLGGDFPNLVRPPLVDLTIAATAPASGVLVSPGTINLPAGSALRVRGDAATLPVAARGRTESSRSRSDRRSSR